MKPGEVRSALQAIRWVAGREFSGYFRTPAAFVLLCAFPLAAIGFPWFVGQWIDREDASLHLFFEYLPWLLAVFIPAIGMRVWAEERRSGSIELLFSLPVSTSSWIVGKYLGAWLFSGIALATTLPLAATAAYLGSPDWGPVVTGYFGAWLVCGYFLGIVSAASAVGSSQVVAFILSLFPNFLLLLAGFSRFNGLLLDLGLPVGVVDTIAGIGLVPHFEPLYRGLVSLGDLLYFLTFIVAHLLLTKALVDR